VDTQQLTAIHQVMLCVTDTVGMLTLPRCDQDDVFELIDRVEAELRTEHPDAQFIATSLTSLALSLRNQPETREACLHIECMIAEAGIPITWRTGI
jgi:hypothetical protein